MEIFFKCLIYGGLVWGVFGLVRHVVELNSKTLFHKIECKTLLGWRRNAPPPDYESKYEPLPDIEKDPLAIEINKAWAKHNGHMYISPNCSLDEMLDVIGKSRSIIINSRVESFKNALIDSGKTKDRISRAHLWARDKDEAE